MASRREEIAAAHMPAVGELASRRELRRSTEPVDAAWAAWEEWEAALPAAPTPCGGGAGEQEQGGRGADPGGGDERRMGRHFSRGHWRRLLCDHCAANALR